MSLRVGIVGLPNVGKSTLFNALTKQAAAVANFPFTTIEPNVGVIPVPDDRLKKLAAISRSEKITPTAIEFVDIAGLVKNAHAGEGLGNRFLSHIRTVDAIAHVVRFFAGDTTHVDGTVDPLRDAATVETELALADLDTIARLFTNAEGDVKKRIKDAPARLAALIKLKEHLSQGLPARHACLSDKELENLGPLPLLTIKPTLYVANIDEQQITQSDAITKEFTASYSPVLPLSVKIEQELLSLSDEERQIFLKEYGLLNTGLERLIKASYQLLGLITFLTTGPTETRAWTVRRGNTAPQAAGKIHTDMEHGFIRAETISYKDLITAGSYAAARTKGLLRDEGKNYVVQDSDVMLFKFST